ncbi:RNA polymerase II transcription factor SIII subunit A [Aspergillus affinis]|uniref:RNA polymerase II transcription factor SIII subunit A n=1 Tax=Aspergillus affinis TaxID=1070780 RepID=UPI0022FE862E|nr:RNA polymerase II transcription factor SIII subunit A [Aspergillus affinis]KAI9036407.1 RNA polymerase II transcription factor SIII subunit A [Aspergillus affinis]
MPAPSLRQLCTATAIRNVKYLSDIGNIPYNLARPFLVKIESPERLRLIESQSPHIIDDDGELWYEFIKRDIPKWDQYELPESLSECSYDLYCDLREQVQRAVDEDARNLKMALDGISSERAKHSAKLVERRHREKPTARQRYASHDRKMGGIGPVFSGTSISPFARPPRPEGKKKNSIFTATKRNSVLAVPTKQLNNRASQVRQAPRSLIEEHRPEAAPPVARRKAPATPALRAPGRSGPHGTPAASLAVPPALQEKEARLRAIASEHRSTSHTSGLTPPKAETESSSTRTRAALPSTSRPPPSNDSGPASRSPTKPGDAARTAPSQPKTSPEQLPRPAPVRKRPPPSVFVQPKRRKL